MIKAARTETRSLLRFDLSRTVLRSLGTGGPMGGEGLILSPVRSVFDFLRAALSGEESQGDSRIFHGHVRVYLSK